MALVRAPARGGRWPSSTRLSLFALPLMALTGSAAAAPSHCDEVPPSERGLCRMVLSCSVIENTERREQCFRAAADAAEDDSPPASAAERAATVAAPAEDAAPPTEAEPAAGAARERAARGVPAPPLERSAREREGLATRTKEPSAQESERPAPPTQTQPEQPPPPTANTVTRETVPRTVLDIPDRFVAEVRSVHALVRNRQLLVLEGDLLFETDRAAQSRIDVGDEVQVVRASSLFGRRYRISGPSGGSTSATRMRCELLELGTDTRRKCALIERSDG